MYSLGRWEGKATRLVTVYCQSLSVHVGGGFNSAYYLIEIKRDNNEWEGRKERRKERKGGKGRRKEERKGKEKNS